MNPREGGFCNCQNQVHSGQRGRDRTSYARRTVNQYEIKVLLLCNLNRLFSDDCNEFPRILLSNSQPGMDEGTIWGFRDKPISRKSLLHHNSIFWTDVTAKTTAFT